MLTRAFILKRDQILVLIAKDFKLKYNSTALGFAWSLIVPIFTSLIYYLVFGMIIRWNVPKVPTLFWIFKTPPTIQRLKNSPKLWIKNA